MKNGVKLIAQERNRQIRKEGWTPLHDRKVHDGGGLAVVAACYAVNKLPGPKIEIPFPWDEQWDKREKHDRKRSLVIAGALIAAELDRLLAEESANALTAEVQDWLFSEESAGKK